ncbi:MAG TPA: hypothetical protein ENK64_02045 [Flavobacteriales bacterium]|jgi:septation ring formation regulator EzrA|nr:hypothetical protein [Flavobacteriales bacterium]
MNQEIISKLDKLEEKIRELKAENFEYQQKLSNFEILLNEKTALLQQCKDENETLANRLEQLKLGKAFAGNTFNNKEAKLKIDSLIKEINLCIAALKA